MKRMKKAFAVIIAAIFCCLFAVSAAADSVYYSDGCYYTYINNSKVSITGWEAESTIVKIPDTINGRYVAGISSRAFYGDSVITGVDFSDASHFESIGMYAFSRSSALSEEILIPESVTELGDCAFEYSTVPAVTISAAVEYVPVQCFNRCDSLTTVNINGQIQEIDSFAFANCPELEYVSIPDSVTTISETAFYNDPKLTIYCNSSSFAQSYAEEHNIPYILLDAVLLGDVNGDGEINISDVTAIQSYLAELITLDEKCLAAADTNQDGTVDISDATALQMYLADYNIPYPIGEYITF